MSSDFDVNTRDVRFCVAAKIRHSHSTFRRMFCGAQPSNTPNQNTVNEIGPACVS